MKGSGHFDRLTLQAALQSTKSLRGPLRGKEDRGERARRLTNELR